MKERMKFVMEAESDLYNMSELCERYGISRNKGYKWLGRYRREGVEGLKDRSRAPKNCPHRTPVEVREQIVRARQQLPRWGPVTLLAWLKKQRPQQTWPAASTVGEILKEAGLLQPRRRRRRAQRGKPRGDLSQARPGEVLSADYKGEFRTGDGQYCYPLTLQDYASRYLLECRGLVSTYQQGALGVFEEVFTRQGLPRIIVTDNGFPFCSCSWTGLTRLSAWWIRLGIDHRRIDPGCPQQNPRHERMHRTLKEETCYPPAPDRASQQQEFDRFRRRYNQERPHQALAQQVPAELFSGLCRPYPEVLPPVRYPKHFELRKVSDTGRISFQGKVLFLAHALAHERVGLEEVSFRTWSVYYAKRLLGRYREGDSKVYG